jgi:transposase
MRVNESKQRPVFSCVSLEEKVLGDHPLRAIRVVVDENLVGMSDGFAKLYEEVGRPSVPPERLLRALLLQVFYSVQGERMLTQQLDYTCCSDGSWAWTPTNQSGTMPCLRKTASVC